VGVTKAIEAAVEQTSVEAVVKIPIAMGPTDAAVVGGIVVPLVCVDLTAKNMSEVHFDKDSPLMYHELIQRQCPDMESNDESGLVCDSER
jgi:hypothetical protein